MRSDRQTSLKQSAAFTNVQASRARPAARSALPHRAQSGHLIRVGNEPRSVALQQSHGPRALRGPDSWLAATAATWDAPESSLLGAECGHEMRADRVTPIGVEQSDRSPKTMAGGPALLVARVSRRRRPQTRLARQARL